MKFRRKTKTWKTSIIISREYFIGDKQTKQLRKIYPGSLKSFWQLNKET